MSNKDSTELQDIFDQYSFNSDDTKSDLIDAKKSSLDNKKSEELYNKAGTLARKLNDALNDIGNDFFSQAGETIPDSKARIQYIRELMESSANKCLTEVENQTPKIDSLIILNKEKEEIWTKISSGNADLEFFKKNAIEMPELFAFQGQELEKLKQSFLKILMAQDFQDLAGQIIFKLLTKISLIERDILEILAISAINNENKKNQIEDFLNGPQYKTDQTNVVHNQLEVDDLLKDLGF